MIDEEEWTENQYHHEKAREESEMLMMLWEEKHQAAFEIWWEREGSGMTPKPDDDMESHAKRISQIAWMNGAYKNDPSNQEI